MKLRYLSLLLFFSIFASAQNFFEVQGGRKTVIPFKFIANLIFIPVTINGADLTFLLDTGVSETSIFSLENKELKLQNAEKIKFAGLGGSISIDGFRSDHNMAKIGKNFINRSMSVYIIVDQDFNISSHVGIPVNGIIGYHFFKDHPVVIDYSSRKITIYNDKELFRKKTRKFEEIDIRVEKNKPYVYAEVEMMHQRESSKLLIDLGNSDPIWLFPALIKDFVYNRPNIDDYLGRGFNGDVYGKRSRIHYFYLGSFAFERPLTAMPDEFSIQHVNLVENRKGSVGGDLMRRFTVALDYSDQKMYLRKNANFNDPFHFNMSGLDFKQDGLEWTKDMINLPANSKENPTGGTAVINNSLPYNFVLKPVFSIAGIRKNSPGEKAGLQKDDRVISINGKKTAEMTLQQMLEMMKSDEGKTIEMLIERKNRPISVKFTLKDPIPYQE